MMSILDKLKCRAKGLCASLEADGQGCKEKQGHLVKNTPEWVYWHYGYYIALRDVIRLLEKEHNLITLYRPGTDN